MDEVVIFFKDFVSKWKLLHDTNFKANHPLSFELFWRELNEKSNLISNGHDVKCHFCHGFFSSQTILNEHVAKFHNEDQTFECSICAMKFISKIDLSYHISKNHKEAKKLKCLICNGFFSNQKLLNEHMEFHTKANKNVEKVADSKI